MSIKIQVDMSDARQLTFRDTRFQVMALSMAVAFLMLAGKGTAFWLTSSTAILSDFAESVVHLFATGFAAFSLWYAATPADSTHPYGHGKISYFAAGIEGALVSFAALGIFYAAGHSFIHGPELEQLGIGLIIIGAVTVINLALGTTLVKVGESHQNLVLISNGKHVLADMWTSLGVLLGVGGVWLTNWLWLDPLIAVLIAAHLLWAGGGLLRRSITGLMETVDQGEAAEITGTLQHFQEEGTIEAFHQLRFRRVGNTIWVEYHLLFQSDLPLKEAHRRSHLVESAIEDIFPKATVYVTAHLEPAAHDVSHPADHIEPSDPLFPHP